VADPADVERQMRPEPPQNLTVRSGAATGADSSSSPTDMDSAPPYNMKQMEIPHSKRREWRCEGFEYHSRPFNLVSRYGVKPGLTSRQLLGLRSGLTILPNASAWSARAHASLLFCSVVEEPFASVNRVDWNRPQPGAPSASPTADPVPSRMWRRRRLWRARLRRRWTRAAARWDCTHAVYGGILQIPGPSHSPEVCTEGIQARPRTCGGESGAPGVS